MRVIYKHQVAIGCAGEIITTEGAEFVHFAEQHGQMVAWVECDPSQPQACIGYRVFGTGEYIDPPANLEAEHRFTALMDGGALVWHLYRIWNTDGR
jgi:hypothetical protein